MLKIRYSITDGMLSGWTDIEAEFDLLEAREGEAVEVLDIAKPDSDDYEYYTYDGKELMPSGKQPPTPTIRRDLATEIDKINAKIADYDELKGKVEALERK